MELQTFFEKIDLPQEAACLALALHVSEAEYQSGKQLFWTEEECFYTWIKGKENFRLQFLYYFSRFACEMYERYIEKGIAETIYWDTFRDITHWCINCRNEFGEYGIDQYDWFFRHIKMTLFCLGRLEFEWLKSEWDFVHEGRRIQKGDPLIFIHIPQGKRLEISECRDSVRQAQRFWKKEYVYICHSWLLYPGLRKILKDGSNILEFQKLFDIIDIDYKEREAEWRIFTKLEEHPEDYPEQTSLQRMARQYLIQGGRLGNGFGVFRK